MADEKHLEILQKGAETWNQWRQENTTIQPDLSGADLSSSNLSNANLSDANLYKVYLSVSNLSNANLSGADLNIADLRAANLTGSNLSNTNLIEADFIGANLSNANLTGAILYRTQALETNFTGAILTGACIADWNINDQTNLQNVQCDYIYLKYDIYSTEKNNDPYTERRPHHGTFKKGEFTKLFQKALKTVDLIFSNGIDWQAFLSSFQNLQVKCRTDELAIQAIERKSNDFLVIRVEVPLDANKAEVEQYLKREYEIQLKAIEEKYRTQLNAKEEQIEIYKQNSANIMKMAELVAKVSNPTIVNLEAKAVAESESKGDRINQKGNFGIGQMSGGEIKDRAKVAGIINEAEQQNLANAATEIQQLLEKLSETYPTTTSQEKNLVIGEAVDQIENNPTLKGKVINALKAGGTEAFKEAVNHPLVNIFVATIEGWQDAE